MSNGSGYNLKPISLIMLVHQEAETIEKVVVDYYNKIISRIPNSEFIICEDGSTDGTKEILIRLKDEYQLTLDLAENKRGYTNAMRDGFKMARNQVIFFSDSDGQHDPNDFWDLYSALNRSDMVIGWKKNRKDSKYRLILTFIFNKLMNLFFNTNVHDVDCGFRIIKKEVTNFLLTQDWRLKHCVNAELTAKAIAAGFKIAERPVSHFSREFGDSRGLPFKKLPKIISHIIRGLLYVRRDLKK